MVYYYPRPDYPSTGYYPLNSHTLHILTIGKPIELCPITLQVQAVTGALLYCILFCLISSFTCSTIDNGTLNGMVDSLFCFFAPLPSLLPPLPMYVYILSLFYYHSRYCYHFKWVIFIPSYSCAITVYLLINTSYIELYCFYL